MRIRYFLCVGAVSRFSECPPAAVCGPRRRSLRQHFLARIEDGGLGQQLGRLLHRRQGELPGLRHEDSGTLQSLGFLEQGGRVDASRVLVLRTVSNHDRVPPGTNGTDSLKSIPHAR
jgi:purine nucleoside permease